LAGRPLIALASSVVTILLALSLLPRSFLISILIALALSSWALLIALSRARLSLLLIASALTSGAVLIALAPLLLLVSVPGRLTRCLSLTLGSSTLLGLLRWFAAAPVLLGLSGPPFHRTALRVLLRGSLRRRA